MFGGFENLETCDMSRLDTSNAKDMYAMFDYCYKLTELNVSSFDTANVTEMRYMFRNCYALSYVDISSFDVSQVENMRWIFQECYELETIVMPEVFNLSACKELSGFFSDCRKLKNIDLSGANTSWLPNWITSSEIAGRWRT